MSYEKVKQATQCFIGTKQTIKAIEADQVVEIFIAKDAEKKVITPIIEQCKTKKLQITFVDSMKKLGKACGIDVGAASVAIKK